MQKLLLLNLKRNPLGSLVKKCGKNKNFDGINKGLGSKELMAEMYVCSNDGVSSMSKEWIAKVRESERFPKEFSWEKAVTIPITTFDALIKSYGIPTFCKIDVEGYEYPVVQGLSLPIQLMSFEYTPEFIESTLFK